MKRPMRKYNKIYVDKNAKKEVAEFESENVKTDIKYQILEAVKNDKNIKKILEHYKFTIKELKELRDKFVKKGGE